jgi:hypothetical protein
VTRSSSRIVQALLARLTQLEERVESKSATFELWYLDKLGYYRGDRDSAERFAELPERPAHVTTAVVEFIAPIKRTG